MPSLMPRVFNKTKPTASTKKLPNMCLARATSESIFPECLAQAAHENVKKCAARVSSESVLQKCPLFVSSKGTSHKIMPPNDRFRRVSHGSQGSPARVQEKCLTEVASRMVFPEQHARGRARESYKACCEIDARRLPDQCPARSLRERERQKKVPHNIIVVSSCRAL